MAATPDTVAWIRNFIYDGIIGNSTVGADGFDDRNYELRVFETPTALYDAVRERSSVGETALSRILATYDWPYSSKSRQPGEAPGQSASEISRSRGTERRSLPAGDTRTRPGLSRSTRSTRSVQLSQSKGSISTTPA